MPYANLCTFPNERTRVTYPYTWWDAAFTEAEINQISAFCASGELKTADTFGGVDEEVRVSSIKHHTWTQENGWIFDKLLDTIQKVNQRWYNFNLNGFEAFQYGEYYAEKGGKYDWHTDMHFGTENIPADMIEPRKLSLSLLLNEPGEDFEGGDFQMLIGTEPMTCPLPKGRMILFPSFLMHRVTPVTRGVRKSIVVWVTGPKFT